MMPAYYGQLERRIAEERNDRLRDSIGPVEKSPTCNYKPRTVECGSYAGHKIIETDTGKEFHCCSQHLGNYKAYNERANYEAFTIVY
jgi:hypothetical protein